MKSPLLAGTKAVLACGPAVAIHADTMRLILPARRHCSGAELTLTTIAGIRDTVLEQLSSLSDSNPFQGFVLLIGTDTLEEAAFLLYLMLGAALRQAGRCLVITGEREEHSRKHP